MAEEMEVGCARPTGGPVGEGSEEAETPALQIDKERRVV